MEDAIIESGFKLTGEYKFHKEFETKEVFHEDFGAKTKFEVQLWPRDNVKISLSENWIYSGEDFTSTRFSGRISNKEDYNKMLSLIMSELTMDEYGISIR